MMSMQIGNGGGLAENSSSGKLRKYHNVLYKSIHSAIKNNIYEEQEVDKLQNNVFNITQQVFLKGISLKEANQIVECIIELGSANNIYRANSASLLNTFYRDVKLTVNGESFKDIIYEYVMKDYQHNINVISQSDFAGASCDIALIYAELFVRFMGNKRKQAKGLLNMTKNVLIALLENKIGSLKCLVNLIKIAGGSLYRGERVFGSGDISMNDIFDRIKDIIIRKENTDRCTRRMLMNVIEMRAEQWTEYDSLAIVLPLDQNIIINENTETYEYMNSNEHEHNIMNNHETIAFNDLNSNSSCNTNNSANDMYNPMASMPESQFLIMINDGYEEEGLSNVNGLSNRRSRQSQEAQKRTRQRYVNDIKSFLNSYQ